MREALGIAQGNWIDPVSHAQISVQNQPLPIIDAPGDGGEPIDPQCECFKGLSLASMATEV
jgi:hypothetical protein